VRVARVDDGECTDYDVKRKAKKQQVPRRQKAPLSGDTLNSKTSQNPNIFCNEPQKRFGTPASFSRGEIECWCRARNRAEVTAIKNNGKMPFDFAQDKPAVRKTKVRQPQKKSRKPHL
jgi:hypothetical protein